MKHNGTMNGLTVAILNWNQGALTVAAVRSALQSAKRLTVPWEVVAIDNGSVDDSVQQLEQQFGNTIRIVKHPKNLGFAEGYNQALSQLTHDWIFFMNNDMELQPESLTRLVQTQTKHPQAFAFTAHIQLTTLSSGEFESGLTYAWQKLGRWLVAHTEVQNSEATPCLYPGGGSSLISKQKFLALHGFDTPFFQPCYAEDLDLGLRAWQQGWECWFVPTALVQHRHHASTKSTLQDIPRIIDQNIQLAFLRVEPRAQFLVHLLGLTARLLLKPQYLFIFRRLAEIFHHRAANTPFSPHSFQRVFERIKGRDV